MRFIVDYQSGLKAEIKLLHSKQHFRMSVLALVDNGETLMFDY